MTTTSCTRMTATVMGLLLLTEPAAVASAANNAGNKRTIDENPSRMHRILSLFRSHTTVPPWFDETPSPTSTVFTSTTDSPTVSPTEYDTEFTTNSPTSADTEISTFSDTEGDADANLTTSSEPPTESPESYVETSINSNGGQETRCSYVPESSGMSVTEIVHLEYFLYLNENVMAMESNTTTTTMTTEEAQDIVDSLLQPKLHNTVADVAFNCSYLPQQAFSIVMLSNDGPGTDLIVAPCTLEAGPSDATACYQVWAHMTVTIWFSDNSRRVLERNLQNTPFGGQSAFYQFVDWLETAFSVLPEAEAGVVGTEFKGFVNMGSLGGTSLSDPQQFGDTPSSLIESSKSIKQSGMPFSYGQAMIVLAGLIMVTLLVFILKRRWRNDREVRKHLEEVDDLHLDTIDEMEEYPVIVDDASLFQENRPLPEEFEVQLEDLHHDYRTCASPSCRACLQPKDPQFVLTDLRSMERSLDVQHRRLQSANNNNTQIL
ncbi:hypothetical protein IV203_002129 [Nitzschia inconspicua]|uniref:Uncharacterized protein n=1 Tax=Nitzschia inconspicua TaxID=303405 RepID=A0A9K3L9V5_9STRA|nr:hypothetical protein IV203_002453 [Nitzschia inconspicua]KAG7357441.1 hypothetical protein IV203_002129 [Nitzschia inconspicua]